MQLECVFAAKIESSIIRMFASKLLELGIFAEEQNFTHVIEFLG
jgi:hypothetical protein